LLPAWPGCRQWGAGPSCSCTRPCDTAPPAQGTWLTGAELAEPPAGAPVAGTERRGRLEPAGHSELPGDASAGPDLGPAAGRSARGWCWRARPPPRHRARHAAQRPPPAAPAAGVRQLLACGASQLAGPSPGGMLPPWPPLVVSCPALCYDALGRGHGQAGRRTPCAGVTPPEGLDGRLGGRRGHGRRRGRVGRGRRIWLGAPCLASWLGAPCHLLYQCCC
jgi:hypothetical protein